MPDDAMEQATLALHKWAREIAASRSRVTAEKYLSRRVVDGKVPLTPEEIARCRRAAAKGVYRPKPLTESE